MKRALVHLALEGGALLALVAAGFLLAGMQPPAGAVAAEQRPSETKDRLSPEKMAEMVAGPVALLEDGREAEADAAARKLVAAADARGDQVLTADLLTAYAVQRYTHGDADAPGDTRRAALPWLREAVTATRRAWGPDHPETALALTDLADVWRGIAPDAPGLEAEGALRQAYAIRLQTLGATHVETLSSERTLADTLSAGPPEASPAPAAASEATGLYRHAGEGFAAHGAAIPARERLGPWLGLASLDARQGRAAEAVADYERARGTLLRTSVDGDPDLAGCLDLVAGARRLEAILKAHGAAEAATRVRGTGLDRLEPCLAGHP